MSKQETLSIIDIRVDVLHGAELADAARAALRLSERVGCGVVFDFNDYELHAFWPHDRVEDIVARHRELWSRRNPKPIAIKQSDSRKSASFTGKKPGARS